MNCSMPLLLLYLGYLLIATFHPFEFPRNSSDSLTRFFAEFIILPKSIGWFGTADFISNVLLFIPCGLLLYHSSTSLGRPKTTTILLAAAGGGFLSFMIEFCQVFLSRNASALDVFANTTGASI